MILSIILIAAMIAALVLFLMTMKNSGKKDSLNNELQMFAAANGGRLTVSDHWKNRAIGLDEHSRMLYFILRRNDQMIKEYIDLLSVNYCRLVNATRTVGDGKNRQTVSDRIGVALVPMDRSKPEKVLEFYNVEHDSAFIVSELEFANKWVEVINKAKG